LKVLKEKMGFDSHKVHAYMGGLRVRYNHNMIFALVYIGIRVSGLLLVI